MEHKTISLAEQVFDRLENDILCGIYKRGELLTENMLVADLKVSRTPVREAIRRLEQEHLVEATTKGILVLGITQEDLVDIMDLRLKIEGIAAARAAERITDGELKELKDALELQEYYVSKKDAEHIKALDNEFHYLVYRFSGSNIIYDTLMPLHNKARKYRKASVENESRAHDSVDEHREIYEAIAARNAALAEQVTTKHVQNAKTHILNRSTK